MTKDEIVATLSPLLRECESRPAVLLDIGSAGGADPRWRRWRPYLNVVTVDARNEGDAGGSGVFTAVGAGPARRWFNIGRKPEVSSLLNPNPEILNRFPDADRFSTVEQHEVDTIPLDAFIEARAAGGVDFLKLDTQGSELEILRSAPRRLDGIAAVEVEVEFLPLYQRQPVFSDVDRDLTARGFRLFDLNRVYWRHLEGMSFSGRGQLVFADALYLKSAEWVFDLPVNAARRLAVMTLACAGYGCWDYAAHLWRIAVDRSVIDERTQRDAQRRLTIVATPALGLRLLRKMRIAPRLSRLATAACELHWASADNRLGNTRK
jgi:hypothetical protein